MQQGCSKLQHELKDHFEIVELDTKKYIKDNMVAIELYKTLNDGS